MSDFMGEAMMAWLKKEHARVERNERIRRLAQGGFPKTVIAKVLGCSRQTVYAVLADPTEDWSATSTPGTIPALRGKEKP